MIRKLGEIMIFKKLRRNDGVALVMSYFVLTSLFVLTAGIAVSNVGELKQAAKYRDSTAAFWAAEAGISRFIEDTSLLDSGDLSGSFGNGQLSISKDDSDSSTRVVTATAVIGGITKQIEVEFPADAPMIFDNTMTSGGDVTLTGFLAGMNVDGKTRLQGEFYRNGWFMGSAFEDKQENQPAAETQLSYPDVDGNGTPDEFNDFVEYNRSLADPSHPDFGEYDASEVEYIPTNGTALIYPSESHYGKKIIFVHGETPGQGNANIVFDSTWAANQNVTVVATGDVNYIQPLQNPSSNSQLNTVSYDDYNEAAILLSAHSGVTYAKDDATFGSIISISHTSGSLVANDDVSLALIAVWKEFDYESAIDANGVLPPGFAALISEGGGGYSSTPSNWKQL